MGGDTERDNTTTRRYRVAKGKAVGKLKPVKAREAIGEGDYVGRVGRGPDGKFISARNSGRMPAYVEHEKLVGWWLRERYGPENVARHIHIKPNNTFGTNLIVDYVVRNPETGEIEYYDAKTTENAIRYSQSRKYEALKKHGGKVRSSAKNLPDWLEHDENLDPGGKIEVVREDHRDIAKIKEEIRGTKEKGTKRSKKEKSKYRSKKERRTPAEARPTTNKVTRGQGRLVEKIPDPVIHVGTNAITTYGINYLDSLLIDMIKGLPKPNIKINKQNAKSFFSDRDAQKSLIIIRLLSLDGGLDVFSKDLEEKHFQILYKNTPELGDILYDKEIPAREALIGLDLLIDDMEYFNNYLDEIDSSLYNILKHEKSAFNGAIGMTQLYNLLNTGPGIYTMFYLWEIPVEKMYEILRMLENLPDRIRSIFFKIRSIRTEVEGYLKVNEIRLDTLYRTYMYETMQDRLEKKKMLR